MKYDDNNNNDVILLDQELVPARGPFRASGLWAPAICTARQAMDAQIQNRLLL